MSKFQDLKHQLSTARAMFEQLAAAGMPSPSSSPEAYAAWRDQRENANTKAQDAAFEISCLRPVDASADELQAACQTLDIDPDKSQTDLAFHYRGARQLERSGWSIGQEVEITAPTCATPRSDAWTGRIGRVVGMSPEGRDVYLSCLDSCEAVSVARIRALKPREERE